MLDVTFSEKNQKRMIKRPRGAMSDTSDTLLTRADPILRAGVITGAAICEEWIAFRPTTVLVEQLEELPRQDASPKLIAEQSYPPQTPVSTSKTSSADGK
jgi:hypothetical protein